jgi:hypothetical protein
MFDLRMSYYDASDVRRKDNDGKLADDADRIDLEKRKKERRKR